MGEGLYRLAYFPEGQLFAGGPGTTELIIPSDKLQEARNKAIKFPGHILANINEHRPDGSITKNLVVLREGTAITIPEVNNMCNEAIEIGEGLGLKLQSDNYASLVGTARILGDLPVLERDAKYFRE